MESSFETEKPVWNQQRATRSDGDAHLISAELLSLFFTPAQCPKTEQFMDISLDVQNSPQAAVEFRDWSSVMMRSGTGIA
jgi:hypothetical protein